MQVCVFCLLSSSLPLNGCERSRVCGSACTRMYVYAGRCVRVNLLRGGRGSPSAPLFISRAHLGIGRTMKFLREIFTLRSCLSCGKGFGRRETGVLVGGGERGGESRLSLVGCCGRGVCKCVFV